jgi:hypothetical protein
MAQGREFPIIGSYDKQRFPQLQGEDCANWYIVPNEKAKKKAGMYPAMGRRHVNYLGQNRLIFDTTPRASFRSRNFAYFVVGDNVIRVDSNYNQLNISNTDFATLTGNVWFAVLYTPSVTYVGFTDGIHLYIYTEETGSFVTITDPKLYGSVPNPTYLAVIGNRFVVSSSNSSQYSLSAINLGAMPLNPGTCFTVAGNAIFAQEDGIIRQMAVNQNILYIWTDFTCGIWSNIQSTIQEPVSGQATTFPLKKNTSYQFQWGMGDPLSLSVDFGIMVWEGQNQSGLIQVVASSGEAPKPIATKAIDVLFQASADGTMLSPFVEFDANGFLYQYENSVFYRLSAGQYVNNQILDVQTNANAIEYSFDTQTWQRVIELNGERNRIERHIYYNNKHLVTVQGDNTVYEMAGSIYSNERTNPAQTDPQALDAYLIDPMRYIKTSMIIAEPDYGEFETEWLQIDFSWGDQTFIYANIGYDNAVYIVEEDNQTFITKEDGQTFLVTETSNFPQQGESHYFEYFKPHIELFFSDDGGTTYESADDLHFSDLGVYSWRMRWYQLGCSRNRVYKLVCVSPAPIVVLGGWMLTRRVSGGAS